MCQWIKLAFSYVRLLSPLYTLPRVKHVISSHSPLALTSSPIQLSLQSAERDFFTKLIISVCAAAAAQAGNRSLLGAARLSW